MKSIVWGYNDYPITQEFGVINPGTAYMYGYATAYGYPAGTHIGLDIGMPRGTPIYAKDAGTVIQAGFSDSFRPAPIWIREDDGDVAIYGHMWTNAVRVGERVLRGQYLGTSGEQTQRGTWTPDGTGPHLHFELRRPTPGADGRGLSGYRAVDPKPELLGAVGEIGREAPILVDTPNNVPIGSQILGLVQRPLVGILGITLFGIGLYYLAGK